MYGFNFIIKVDVWFLGCIFLEILVWSYFGDFGWFLFMILCMGVGGYWYIVILKLFLF